MWRQGMFVLPFSELVWYYNHGVVGQLAVKQHQTRYLGYEDIATLTLFYQVYYSSASHALGILG
jgi:hypothetical protein